MAKILTLEVRACEISVLYWWTLACCIFLQVEVNNERYVNPGHVECDTGTIYDYPISDPDPGTVCSDVDIGPPLMPVSVHYTCTPVHYTLEHEPHSKDET
jgi:hypothetical protein